MLACYRYIELNPLRAAMVDTPEDYRWSSYRANALGEPNPLLSPHGLYMGLGKEPADCQNAYRRLFLSHPDSAMLREVRS
ncbi:MAG: hypothetical protein LJE91_02080 [Gammaproteobacteria bacterium]|nr:hypothetical protein [Gammaproteobacteria bacterium]